MCPFILEQRNTSRRKVCSTDFGRFWAQTACKVYVNVIPALRQVICVGMPGRVFPRGCAIAYGVDDELDENPARR